MLQIVEMSPIDWDQVVKSIATTTGYKLYYGSDNESSEAGE